MENVLGIGAFIAIVIMMIVNLYLYHKIFRVLYFNLGKGIIMEIIFAWLIAVIEVAVFGSIIKLLFGGIIKLLGIVFKIALIIFVIAAVVFIVWKIVQALKGRSDGVPDQTKENSDYCTHAYEYTYDASERRVEYYDTGERSQTEQETGITVDNINKIHVNTCAYCGTVLADNAIFCSECGSRIQTQNTARQYMFCSECGTKLPSDALFCDNYGTAQNN